MPIGLYDLTAHTIGNKVYIFGGYGAGGFNNAVMEYDVINDSWSLKEPMPTYRYLFQSEVIDNLVYVIGGQGTIDDGPWESGKEWEYKSHVEIYNPVLDSWSTGTPAPRNLATGASCSLYDDIYIFGGNNGSIQSTAFAYNVVSDSWRELSGSSVAREGHECIEQGDNFYLLGGRNSTGALNLLETYSTVTNLWADEGYIPSARYWFSAALYESSIYLFGGKDSSNTDTNSVVVYKLSGS